MPDPTLLILTVMKNEGPFILEWIAWQRLMGIDHFVVMTNDCDDGTDLILDQLDRMGIVTHLPNPIEILPEGLDLKRSPQMAAFAYGRRMREWRDADYIFLTDVDEFPLLRGGDTSLKTLLKRLDYPDVLSLPETLFGLGGVIAFEDRPVTAQFTRSAGLTPGKWRSRRGFKSIARNDPRLVIRNHRPIARADVAGDLRWLDGSGREFPMELRHVHQKGTDARGMFDLVTLNHYTIRSLESFLVKQARGDSVAAVRLGETYFRRRNQVEAENTEMLAHVPRIEEEVARLKADSRLADLHAASVEAHRAKIASLKATPLYNEFLKLADLQPADG